MDSAAEQRHLASLASSLMLPQGVVPTQIVGRLSCLATSESGHGVKARVLSVEHRRTHPAKDAIYGTPSMVCAESCVYIIISCIQLCCKVAGRIDCTRTGTQYACLFWSQDHALRSLEVVCPPGLPVPPLWQRDCGDDVAMTRVGTERCQYTSVRRFPV